MNHFLAVAVVATQQGIEGSDSQKKKKKDSTRQQQQHWTPKAALRRRDRRLTWPKSENARSVTAKVRSGNKNLSLQRAAMVPPLTSSKYFSSLSFFGFPYLISALILSLSLSLSLSLFLSLNTQSDLCCNLWVLWVRLIFWQYCLVFVFLCKCM